MLIRSQVLEAFRVSLDIVVSADILVLLELQAIQELAHLVIQAQEFLVILEQQELLATLAFLALNKEWAFGPT
jgi:hypothetical protein